MRKAAIAIPCALAAITGCALDPQEREPDEGSTSQPVLADRRFGTHSTDDYENNWQVNLHSSTAMSRLIGELDNEASSKYWYNLWNKLYYWHDSGDHAANSLEDVDMFITFTHGGGSSYSSTTAAWAMWDDGDIAESKSMRLGDELRQLSIFTQFSCETLAFDGNTWARWDSVMKGGLRAALASHDKFYWGTAEYDVGKVFAQYLNAGYTLKQSWAAGWDLTAYNNQDVAVLFAGNSSSDCTNRRDNMTWDNFQDYARRRDANASYWCGWYWDDI